VGIGLVAEVQPARHGREHGAEAFAVAAGVADLQDARDFLFAGSQRQRGGDGNHAP